MRCLPCAMTRGPWFTQILREARQDSRRNALCPSCGASMMVEPDKIEQTVRCQACARWQTVTVEQDVPWHLTPDAAQALRRTRSWLRRI
jgi:tRNA(Ile2) C34 agmatinyltransferase TiaS